MEINFALQTRISMFCKERHPTTAAAKPLCLHHPQRKMGSRDLINCLGGCFVFCEMLKLLPGGFWKKGFFHSNVICSLQKPRGGLGQGMEASAQALEGPVDPGLLETPLKFCPMPAPLLPTRRCNLSSLQKQTCSHKTHSSNFMVREERRTARVLLLIRKMAATFCMTIACFHFFFFTFKIKNLPKKAYKVYGRGIQEAN